MLRHRWPTRLWHWINAVTLLVLLMSGLTIFNAHPRLYWGSYGANDDYAWMEIGTRGGEGYMRVGGAQVGTTGVLGVWRDDEGAVKKRAFPHWATIPSSYSLADGRLWHLAFAWVLALGLAAYLAWLAVSRRLFTALRLRPRDFAPRHLWQEVRDHARLRFPTGAAALDYNTLQKASYALVLVGLLPLVIATGLTMSPGINAAAPWLLDLFGGRQSARSLHFLAALGLVLFTVVHVLMVVLAGPVNELRSMITGRYRLPPERGA